MKEEKRMITIRNSNGEDSEVELITYLISDDNRTSYMVYSKGEKVGAEDDEILYITRIEKEGNLIKMNLIESDEEWQSVQALLKKIANA
ncbi:MAG: DUF1292 domain-containing protein [Bacilli bacterium]|nr:DUF1292 domain-containing protein [Bacilli bacterium]